MECFLEVFDKNRIEALTADREFIGKEWLSWLRTNQIRYVFRVRENRQYIVMQGEKWLKYKSYFAL
ncbi:transposase [Rickettsia tamurae]|uniref:transposase n=1 Tax=Rickettsia tamurae TaxID=334545 RepID=UPI0030812C47